MRRWACLLLCLLFLPVLAEAAGTCTEVQFTGNNNSSASSLSAAFSSSNTAGNSIVVLMYALTATGGMTFTGVSDSKSNSYSVDNSSAISSTATHYSHLYVQAAIATGIAAGPNTVTITANPDSLTGFGMSVHIYEVQPAGTSGCVLDTQVTASANSNANNAGPSMTTTGNGAFVVTGILMDDGFGFGSGWWTAGTGWTLSVQAGGGNEDNADEYQNQTSAGSVTGNFNANFTGVTGPWVQTMIDLIPQPSGGGGGTCQPTLNLLGVSSCG